MPDLGRAGPVFDGWSGIHQALSFVITIENELDSRRHTQFVKQANQVLVPTVADLLERDPDSIALVYRDSYRVVFWLAVPAFACLTVASPLISRVWIGRFEPPFVEFVTILSAAWLVNVLANPAYVVDLGTASLRWVSLGCITTAILNAALGVLAGRFAVPFGLGGLAVVSTAASSLALGYAIVLIAYHFENRVAFAQLLPEKSGPILAAAVLSVFVCLPAVCTASVHSSALERPASTAILLLLTLILVSAWRHPMRRRVWRWVFSRVPA